MIIKKYDIEDEKRLFELLVCEGEEWSCYYNLEQKDKYKLALIKSITYVGYQDEELIGFIRLRDDDGFGIYVYDLLVHKDYRGKAYGKKFLDYVKNEYLEETVYVMSDVDDYYHKLGYQLEGSIFIVK